MGNLYWRVATAIMVGLTAYGGWLARKGKKEGLRKVGGSGGGMSKCALGDARLDEARRKAGF